MRIYLDRAKFVQSLLTGGTGAALCLSVTSVLTEFVFSREGYFTAYLLGVACGVVFAFIMFMRFVFKTTTHLARRFFFFASYMVILVIVQAVIVKYAVSVFGVDWYFVVIACVIGALSAVNYVVYQNWIFVETDSASDTLKT